MQKEWCRNSVLWGYNEDVQTLSGVLQNKQTNKKKTWKYWKLVLETTFMMRLKLDWEKKKENKINMQQINLKIKFKN